MMPSWRQKSSVPYLCWQYQSFVISLTSWLIIFMEKLPGLISEIWAVVFKGRIYIYRERLKLGLLVVGWCIKRVLQQLHCRGFEDRANPNQLCHQKDKPVGGCLQYWLGNSIHTAMLVFIIIGSISETKSATIKAKRLVGDVFKIKFNNNKK